MSTKNTARLYGILRNKKGHKMESALKLDQLNLSDKFIVLEELWEDMSKHASANGFTPQWHLEILKEREDKNSVFSNIKDVKQRLQKQID